MWIFILMAHKYPNLLVHLVFSTKQRANLIPADLLPRLGKYFAGIGKNHGIPVLAAGGIANHVHLLVALPPDTTTAKAVQVLKANSSRWIRQHGSEFAWQEGYGAFSVSSSNKDAVVDYIKRQAEHHRVRSYETEFEAMIRKSGMTFDAKEAFG
jgi:REP element-mobilizing transposase RayT